MTQFRFAMLLIQVLDSIEPEIFMERLEAYFGIKAGRA
jgi:hypothetical protein